MRASLLRAVNPLAFACAVGVVLATPVIAQVTVLVPASAKPPAVSGAASVGPAATPETLPGSADCARCHARLIKQTEAEHKGLRAVPCVDCHAPSTAPDGRCASATAKAWTLAASEVTLCTRCHTQILAHKGPKHAPIAKGKCSDCHVNHGGRKPGLLRKGPVSELCYGCHERLDDGAWVHAPLNTGECLVCHDPHVGRDQPVLAGSREALCTRCHETQELLSKGRSKHAPVRTGHCATCHNPHEGNGRALLKATGRALCVTCHDAAKPLVRGSASRRLDLTRKFVHEPVVKGDCQECHTQKHASEHEGLLARPATDSCYRCHDPFDRTHRYLHGAVKLGDCAVCHDVHASDYPALLAEPTINPICFRCHEDDVTARKWVHKVLVDQGCTACHDPHGGDNDAILKKGDTQAACASCHPKIGVGVKFEHEAIARAGCDGCHDPHGSNNPNGLHQPVNKLCLSCHPTIGPAHVGAFGGAHILSGVPDVRRKGEEFSCVSCHKPHGSDSPRILLAGTTESEVCKACH